MLSIKIGIIGCGAIGTDVAKAADEMNEIKKIFLYDIKIEKAEKLCNEIKKGEVKKVEDFLGEVDIVFEAASKQCANMLRKSLKQEGI